MARFPLPPTLPLRPTRAFRTTTALPSRKRRGRAVPEDPASAGPLGWETFEFGRKPKLDARFDSDVLRLDPEAEGEEDARAAAGLRRSLGALDGASPKTVAEAAAAVAPLLSEKRRERIEEVLGRRTSRSRFLFENPANPSNVWACLRTIDSFGIQNVDVVVDSSTYVGASAIAQKKGMRTAMGSAQWLSLRSFPSTADAVRDLKDRGYKIYASDLNPDSQDVRELNWDEGPVCVVMGNEESGISEEMRAVADKTFTLPMVGFAESFNLSAATAITLAHMSARSDESRGTGPLRPGDLDGRTVDALRLKWMLGSLPKRKMGAMVLRRHGIELPELFLEQL